MDGRCWLGPTHFDEGLSEWDHFFANKKETAKFCFGGRGHDVANDVGNGEDRAVMRGEGDIFGEHDVGASAAACFADVEVRGVCVAAKDHAAGTVRDAIVGICSEVIEELEHVGVGVLCGR